jgi:pantoate--beta-alanine ligase
MRIIKKIELLRRALRAIKRQNRTIGFVPTMGALHEGHLSLIRKARRENNVVVLSIFVNPKQFGPKEDFKAYPRPEKKDILLAKKEKVDIIFYPSEKEMYPAGFLTNVRVDTITSVLCGKSRPGHFAGVTTVVGKLLNAVGPDVLYLGQKDAQQAVVLKRMITDLNFPVAVKVCPIVREPDGLAMSSRNQYLAPKQRKEATVLFRALKKAKREIRAGEQNAAKITRGIRGMIRKQSSGKIDYISCVDAETLTSLKYLKGTVLIALAVKFGRTRLIDNIIVHIA